MHSVIYKSASEIKHGPFTWVKRLPVETVSGSTDEVWRLQHPEELERIVGLTSFAVKNYGGEPGPGFKGWKLVSGGPFDAAGSYDNLEAAIKGVTPYVVAFYRRQAVAKLKEAEQIILMISAFGENLAVVTAGEHLRNGV